MPHLWSPILVMILKSQCSEAVGRITDTDSGLKTRFSVFPVGFFLSYSEHSPDAEQMF